MCGICGELSFDRSRPVSADVVRAMRDQITHRGPDACGVFVSPDGLWGLLRSVVPRLVPEPLRPVREGAR